jgi:molybdopterin adenylyltransferase
MAGGRIDAERAFTPLHLAVLTISDSRDQSSDSSGQFLADRIGAAGHRLSARNLLKHDKAAIQGLGQQWIDDPGIDVIVSNGGTGLAPRDVAPEAWRNLFEREFDGFSTLWHQVSYETVGVSTLQSRACAGLARGTVIYVIPGSTGACRDAWDKLISLAIDSRHRPCSVVDLIARFQRP